MSERLSRVMVPLATALLRLWFASCRIEIRGRPYHERYILGNHKVVGATWHRGAIFLVWFFRNAHPMIMFSRSKDGDLIAGFAERLGILPVRGSSSRGGRAALKAMVRYLRQPGDRKAATVVDGPRGPRYRVKEGMILAAMLADVPLLPIMVSANPALTLRRTWDRTLIPLPFSRVVVSYGKPWHVRPGGGSQALEGIRREVERVLNEMREAADAATGYTDAAP
ncbi:MAG: lysophospholipid acyltransferase family protein [Desulfosarcinaceae bacterium]|nr:lysophospholipid acyltransferase family protein [Desulfosarcinaceae bacterium]